MIPAQPGNVMEPHASHLSNLGIRVCCVSDVWAIETIVNADLGDGVFPWVECRYRAAYREFEWPSPSF